MKRSTFLFYIKHYLKNSDPANFQFRDGTQNNYHVYAMGSHISRRLNNHQRKDLSSGYFRVFSFDVFYLLWLCVKSVCLDIGVVNTIFFTSGDTDLHLQPDLHGSHSFKVLNTCCNILLIELFRQVQHVT